MKREEATVGRFIECNGDRMKIVYVNAVRVCVEVASGEVYTFSSLENCTLLPPECDSFEWQAETFPQYWTAYHESVAFNRRDSAEKTVRVLKNGTEEAWETPWEQRVRDWHRQITESEAIALLREHLCVTQDRVPARPGIDERQWVGKNGEVVKGNGWRVVTRDMISSWAPTPLTHGFINSFGSRLELRCHFKDLPPLPEPPKTSDCPGEGYRLIEDNEITLPTDEREYLDADGVLRGDINWTALSDVNPKMVGITLSGLRRKWGNIIIRRKIEPAKPATRKVVLTEWLVEWKNNNGDQAEVITQIAKPIWSLPAIVTAIGTREIEVPL